MHVLKLALITAASIALGGCLTVAERGAETQRPGFTTSRKAANVALSLEAVSWQGTRVLFTEEQAQASREELVSVLREFGIETTKDSAALKVDAKLVVKDAGCEVLFMPSNCWVTLFAQPLTLYLLPTSFQAEHAVSLHVQDGDAPVVDLASSANTRTHVHLFFLPLVPYEVWSIKDAQFRKDIYRKLLTEAFARNTMALQAPSAGIMLD